MNNEEIINDDDNKELFIEPTVIIDINQSDQSSLTIIQRFSGIFYALLSSLFFTSSVFITKQLKIDLLDALFFRFLFQTITLFIYMKFIKHYILYSQTKTYEKLTLFINVFFATTGFLSFFIAYRYLPLPDLTTIRYTQVIWTAFIIAIMYHEKPSISIILSIILTIIGVICVAQPEFLFFKKSINKISKTDYSQRLIGLFIGLYCSISMAIMIISNKILLTKYKSKHSLILFQFGFISLIIISINLFYKYYYLNNTNQYLKINLFNWRYFISSFVCLLQMIASIFIQKSVKREHPSIFTIAQSSDILFSILLQNIFSSIKTNLLSLIGSILVLTSILIISIFKLFNDKKNEKKMKTIET